MATASRPTAEPYQRSVFRYKSFHISKDQFLGHGSYGAVYKAKCDQLPCAAKVLHHTIVDPRNSEADRILQRFKQECAFLENIRHPNIVQFLGMNVEPESRLPVLLMELLDESLTKMLEHSKQLLPYHVQVDICHDIALAVAYLHSNDIIHRDLSSNNVLIIAGRRAKVTDFGMSKLAGSTATITPLTVCPGTLAYMAPEALRESPNYTKKLDCFSQGVIMIQVCTRLLPEPGPRTRLVSDVRSPTGTIEMPVLEVDRRKSHIEQIEPTHPMLSIAMDCLSYQEKDRPSSEMLCQRLSDLKESSIYSESTHVSRDQKCDLSRISKLEEKIRDLKVSHEANEQLIQQKDEEMKTHKIELREKDRLLQQKECQFQRELVSRERQIQKLNRELEEQRKLATELKQINQALQKEVKQIPELPSRQRPQSMPIAKAPKPPSPVVRHPAQIVQGDQEEHVYCSLISGTPQLPQQQLPPKPRQKLKPPEMTKMALEWRDGGSAPYIMERGDAVGNGNMAYFVGTRGEACSYNAITKKWNELPKCPYGYSSLAVVYGHLTAIGGCTLDKFDPQNKLVSRMGDRGWIEHFPPMPTKRWKTIAVTTQRHLVVAGGKNDSSSHLNIVEVLDIQNVTWSTVASLPHPYSEASAAICGDRLYILGGFDQNGKTKSVLTCSLTKLLRGEARSLEVCWRRLADSPTTRSTCAAVNGVLLVVGGLDEQNRKTSAIYVYKSTANSWELISNMPTAQYNRLVAVLPTNEVIVVGGCTRFKTDKVDIAKTNVAI